MKEEWKPVKGCRGRYYVSKAGQVRAIGYVDSSGRKRKPKLRKLSKNSFGYLQVDLVDAYGKKVSPMVHRLVMQAFVGFSDLVVDHKNGDHADNRIENLRYVTQRENLSFFRKDRGRKSSKYTGVSWNKKNKKWVAQFWDGKRNLHLGLFESEKTARDAYLQKLNCMDGR